MSTPKDMQGIANFSFQKLAEYESMVSDLLASLGHTGRRRVVLGYTLNTQTLTKTDNQKKILSKITILCWATFIAILGRMRPMGHGLDTPGQTKEKETNILDHAELTALRVSQKLGIQYARSSSWK